MNRERWAKYDKISLLRYLSKLAEETGEVATEVNDVCDLEQEHAIRDDCWQERKRYFTKRKKRLEHMDEELSQVIFIATQMRNRVELEREIVRDELADLEP